MNAGRRLGEPLPDWTPRPAPVSMRLEGRVVDVEPLDAEKHALDLFDASHGEGADPDLWLYMGVGPFVDAAEFRAYLERIEGDAGLAVFTICDKTTGRAVGSASLMRFDPPNGVVEIGSIWFGESLQRSTGATESIFLIAEHVFNELGYRRLEWKCNALHERSRRAALRFGFTYEGTFRQHMVVKGRNRDTAWFAILDHEWPAIRRAFQQWLDPVNFDADNRQLKRLEEFRRP